MQIGRRSPSTYLSCARSINRLPPRHIHASDVFTYSFLPVLSRSASSTLPLRTPVHGLYSPSFSIHPRHMFHPTQSSSSYVSHIFLSHPFPCRLVCNIR